ncbi:MAG: carotenoid biosynthesis protein [Phycisphaeraceae bacterium]
MFAVETAAGVFYPSLASTVLQLATMVAFMLLHGALRYRVEGIAVFAVICLVVSNIFENLGVATGFPFGPYHYTDALGPKLFYVPLMIGPAYLSVGYMAWVLATILAGDVRRGASAFSTFATPFVAAFIMVLWDVSMDPSASTVQKWWIWESGGGFFGVPVSNYIGWFLTVYVFMQLFAIYLRARAPVPEQPQPKSYFIQAIAMYAIVALGFVLSFLVEDSAPVTDATGAAWLSGDIYETAVITSLFTMMFVVALAAIKVMQDGSVPAKAR